MSLGCCNAGDSYRYEWQDDADGSGFGFTGELRITYPTRELRDMILGTGMVGGMETSYARLQTEILD